MEPYVLDRAKLSREVALGTMAPLARRGDTGGILSDGVRAGRIDVPSPEAWIRGRSLKAQGAVKEVPGACFAKMMSMGMVSKFLGHVVPGVIKPLHALWNQVIGFLFLVFALLDRKSTRLNSSHIQKSRMPSSA